MVMIMDDVVFFCMMFILNDCSHYLPKENVLPRFIKTLTVLEADIAAQAKSM